MCAGLVPFLAHFILHNVNPHAKQDGDSYTTDENARTLA